MRSGARRFLVAVASAFAITPISAAGQAHEATVVDPQGRVVPGARLTVSCPDGRQTEGISDAEGRVVLPRTTDPSNCILLVSHQGFAPISERFDAKPWPRQVHLAIAPVRERVDVTAPMRTRLRTSAAASATLTRQDLEWVGSSTADWIRYATAVAGVTSATRQLLVDGLPASTAPPRSAIAQIAINLDPFSAEFASPDQTQIEIVTEPPTHAFRMGATGGGLPFGGRNPLASGARSTSRSFALAASGALPRRFAFMAEGSINRSATPRPLFRGSMTGGTEQSDAAISVDSGASVNALLFRGDAGSVQWRGIYSQSSSHATATDAGGVTRPEAARDTAFDDRSVRLTVHGQRGWLRYRGGAAWSAQRSVSDGAASEPALRILGTYHGAAPVTAGERSSRRSAMLKAVATIDHPKYPIEFGGELTGGRIARAQTPNPFGAILFVTVADYEQARRSTRAGIRFLEIGDGEATVETGEASAFVQAPLVSGPRGFLRAGLRADAQTRDRPRWSPRVFGTLEAAGFLFSGGAGLFTQNWADDLFANTLLRDAHHLNQLVTPGVGIGAPESGTFDGALRIVSGIDPGFRRRRDVVWRAAVERPIGPMSTIVEYTFTRGRHLAGARRTPEASGWMDVLESRERLIQRQLHTRVLYFIGRQQLSFHYEAVRSRDTTAGPYATERHDSDTLARSAGVPPFRFSAVAALRLPAGISLAVTGAADGPTPYDVTSLRDPSGMYLFTDRGTRPRNSGTARGARHLTLHGHRWIGLPERVSWLPRQIGLGVEIDNPFGWKRYVAYGSVLGTDLFGQPLDALSGRSVRFWLAL